MTKEKKIHLYMYLDKAIYGYMEEMLSFILDYYYRLVSVGKGVKDRGAKQKRKKYMKTF